ncbi:MAG: 50S ribosomal protein L4 [Xanthomonadales bacterium]|nr:50S ribosomal protein L4 [Xanthomonadales bacterium]MBW7934902.1 50S ribosomal protein L4 [Gemmatimonadaceae bacterium]MCC6597159.1 50S ribosomal protein L4 [Rhodanobacteraceae bacterium]MDL1868956.1 50S ribosomal protein L4 [Gammaproteobacteria bacterium PRO6]
MELNVIGAKPVSVSDAVFGKDFREDLVHQVVVAYRNAGRAGTKRQKSRSEVSGTTKKSKRQKGGGARHGALTAPIFTGGGVTFAARPRSFAQKVNRKMFRGAIASILSELARQDRLVIVESIGVEQPRTSLMVARLAELNAAGRVVVVTENGTEALYLAARNIPYLQIVDVAALDPVSLVGADKVVMTVESLKRAEEWLA